MQVFMNSLPLKEDTAYVAGYDAISPYTACMDARVLINYLNCDSTAMVTYSFQSSYWNTNASIYE